MFNSKNHPILKDSLRGEFWRGPYIIPQAELASMTSERAFLGGASEIPFGGETGEFDTHALTDWEEEWSTASDE